MTKRMLPYAVAAVIICTGIGLQPAHSEKAPIPKPPKLEEGGGEKKSEKKEEKREGEKKEVKKTEVKLRVVSVDHRRKIVQLAPPYRPKPVLKVKVPPRAIRQLRPGTVVEVHQRGNKTILRTSSGTVEGYRVTGTESSSVGRTVSSSSLQTGSASPAPSRASAGAGTHGTTVNAKVSPSKGGKTAGSKSKSKENTGKRGKKGKNRSEEKTNVNGSKSSGSSNLELQREASGESSSGWTPYLVALALVGAATGGMWLVKQRRSTTWEWE
ncbi:hypothetical protein [Methanopyrus sp.]